MPQTPVTVVWIGATVVIAVESRQGVDMWWDGGLLDGHDGGVDFGFESPRDF
jgi:hypothetical protein